MEHARNRVNRFAEVLCCGGKKSRYPRFICNFPRFYQSDGVQFSKVGNYLYLNNIQGAIEYFVGDSSRPHFTAV